MIAIMSSCDFYVHNRIFHIADLDLNFTRLARSLLPLHVTFAPNVLVKMKPHNARVA